MTIEAELASLTATSSKVLNAATAALAAHAEQIDENEHVSMVRLEVRLNARSRSVRRVVVQVESEYDPRD